MPLLGAFIMPHPPVSLPEVGKGQEAQINKTCTACETVAKQIKELAPDTIILLTPHSVMYADYFHISPRKGASGNLSSFGAPNVRFEVEYDTSLASDISAIAEKDGIQAGYLGEKERTLDHGSMVPLYFVNKYYKKYKIVRIGLSGMTSVIHYQFGKSIAKAVKSSNKKVVLIASGDLSHKLSKDGPYGFAQEGVEFDRSVTKAMESADFLNFLTFSEGFCKKAAECGLHSFQVMAGVLDGYQVKSELLSYEGPFGVGYAVAMFMPKSKGDNRNFDVIYERSELNRLVMLRYREDDYVKLARLSLENHIKNNGLPFKLPNNISDELTTARAGVFVSLHKYGALRACIGTIHPVTNNIAEEIIKNSVSAGTQDPRFSPVTINELSSLEYKVDVLLTPEIIDSPALLDVNRYGVIVSSGERKGLLLPNLEGVDTVTQQIDIAKQKAGIAPDEECEYQRFEVIRHT